MSVSNKQEALDFLAQHNYGFNVEIDPTAATSDYLLISIYHDADPSIVTDLRDAISIAIRSFISDDCTP